MLEFFPFSKIARLHDELSTLKQNRGECLSEAWDGFFKLISLSSKNIFDKYVILHIFYNGIDNETKPILDISIGGVFMSLTLKAGEELI